MTASFVLSTDSDAPAGRGDRCIRRIRVHPVRDVRRQVHADAGLEDELLGYGLHCREVALATVHVAVELALKRGRIILKGGDVDVLYALDLEQEAMFDVEVHRRR
jgi:hypothetical protein